MKKKLKMTQNDTESDWKGHKWLKNTRNNRKKSLRLKMTKNDKKWQSVIMKKDKRWDKKNLNVF